MELEPENPHFRPAKYPKCNISQITAHKLPKTDVVVVVVVVVRASLQV